MIYVGIDPGNKGGIVAINERREVVLQAEMPVIDVGKGRGKKRRKKIILDQSGYLAILLALKMSGELFVILEKAQVVGSAGGRSPASPRAMFQYGRGFGALEMGLLALGIPFEEVHPTAWAKVLKGIEGTDNKARAILQAQRSLPGLDLLPGRKRKPHDGLAEAGCMALHGMMIRPVAGAVLPKAPSLSPQKLPPLPPLPPPRRKQ